MTEPRRQFRDAMRALLPWWLNDRGPEFANTGFKWLWSVGAVLDGLVEAAVQGAQAAWPGLGTATALRYTGRARGIRRGVAESDASYAERQRRWLDSLKALGHPFEMLRGVRSYLGVPVKCRAVDFTGNWHTIEVDGTEWWTLIEGSWNWDGSAASDWAQGHVIIYVPEGLWEQWEAFWTEGDTPWGGNLEGGNLTIGSTTPWDVANDLRELLRYLKPGHMVIREVIIALDPDSFDPGNPATWPDGTWGTFTAGEPQALTRPTTARYWEGVR